MVGIIIWIHPGEIFQLFGYDCIFFEKTRVRVSWIYLPIGIDPSLIEIRCDSHRISTTGIGEFRSGNQVARYRPISPAAVLCLKYAPLIQGKYNLWIRVVIITEKVKIFG